MPKSNNYNNPGIQDLPIVIPFCHTGHELAKNWKNFVQRNQKFQNFCLITAYCNSKICVKSLSVAHLRAQLVTILTVRPIIIAFY